MVASSLPARRSNRSHSCESLPRLQPLQLIRGSVSERAPPPSLEYPPPPPVVIVEKRCVESEPPASRRKAEPEASAVAMEQAYSPSILPSHMKQVGRR